MLVFFDFALRFSNNHLTLEIVLSIVFHVKKILTIFSIFFFEYFDIFDILIMLIVCILVLLVRMRHTKYGIKCASNRRRWKVQND